MCIWFLAPWWLKFELSCKTKKCTSCIDKSIKKKFTPLSFTQLMLELFENLVKNVAHVVRVVQLHNGAT